MSKRTTHIQHDLRLARSRQLRQQAPNTEHFVWEMLRGSRLAGYKFRRQESIGNCESREMRVESREPERPRGVRLLSGSRLSTLDSRLPRGISLLEVLISMFVLTVGLLGLASMVPVGQFQVQQANNAYFAAATGRSLGFSDIKVRNLLDDSAWVRLDASGVYQAYSPTAPNAFLIDGLGVASNYSPFDANYRFFPAGGAATFPGSSVGRLERASLLDKVRFDGLVAGGMAAATARTNASLSRDAADRIFRGLDDSIFQLASDTTMRPQAVGEPFTDSNGNGRYDNGESYTDSNGNGVWNVGPAQQQNKGDFSWMVMVQPAVGWDTTNVGKPMPPNQAVAYYLRGLGTTTVVVFNKRDLTDGATPPAERALWADLDAVGPGSLDIELRDTSSTTLEAAKQVMKLRPGQWVMISSQIAAQNIPGTATVAPANTPAINVHRWFRVVIVGEVELEDPTTAFNASTNPYTCDVSLGGLDLGVFDPSNNLLFNDADSTNSTGTNGMTFVCTICDGAIGVFEKTVRVAER